jgi:chemotaxis protein histidine kinase CheA
VNTIVSAIEEHQQHASSTTPAPAISASVGKNLQRLATQVSQNQNKQIQLKLNLSLLDEMDSKVVQQLQQIGIQLIRNSICHGIESPEIRIAKGKSPIGEISLAALSNHEGAIEFTVRDDGQGIVPSRIRAAMIASGKYAEASVNRLSDKEVVAKLFEPGFSTSNSTDKDAGRGIGMDLVQSLVNEIGGDLKIDTKPDVFTQFAFRISKPITPLINLYATEAAV